MAWVREKNPKRKVSAPQRDPKDALEGLLSYLACKSAPPSNMQRYLRETSPQKAPKPEIVQREPTAYDGDEGQYESDDDPEPVQNQRRRNHQHRHEHQDLQETPPPSSTPAPRHVSNFESRPYRPKTSVQTRRVVSSWSNATTPLAI